MTTHTHVPRTWPVVATFTLLAVIAASPVFAQFGLVIEGQLVEIEEPNALNRDEGDEEEEALGQIHQNQMQINEEHFPQWVFNGTIQQGGDIQKHFATLVKAKFAVLEPLNLSVEQKNRLENAALGDIHRFVTDYDRVRRSIKFGMISQEEWQKVWEKIGPLQARFQLGLHGPHSLFQKSIVNVLSPEQREKYNAMEAERRKRQHTTSARILVAQIENQTPLTKDQRTKLLDLILAETKLPDLAGRNTYPHLNLLAQLKSVSDQKFQGIFTPNELMQVRKAINQAQGYANIANAVVLQAGELKSE